MIHTETIVSIGLVISLILAIFFGSNELSMSIASGLLGFLGRSVITKKGTK
nr:MAG TPA: hypothetical protein [Caudoviricetes sp.]